MDRKFRRTGISFLTLGALLVGASCRGTCGGSSGDRSQVVAKVGDGAITLDEVKAKLNEQPAFVRARYDTVERKKEFVDNLVRFELLSQEARRRGLDKDPEVQAMLEKVMVQRLVKAIADEAKADVGDDEARKYYEGHKDEFVRPERVRLSHIFFASPRSNAERAQRKAEALKLLSTIKASAGASQAFEDAARSKSEDADTRAAGGDLGFRTREELEQLGGAALAQAAFGLKGLGEVGALVETDRGFHLVKLTSRQPGLDQPFESVKARIANRLGAERRTKSLDTFIAELRKGADVKIDEEALKKLDVRALASDDAASH